MRDFAEYIYHVRSSHDLHSIIQSGLILGGKDIKKRRHAVFFTVVSPMFIDHFRERDYDVTQPRIAVYKHNCKIHQNTVNCLTLRVAQKKGSACFEKAVVMNSQKVLKKYARISSFNAKSCTKTGVAKRTKGYSKHLVGFSHQKKFEE